MVNRFKDMYKIPKPGLYENHNHRGKDMYIYVTHVDHESKTEVLIYYYTLSNPLTLFPILPYPFNSNFSLVE